MKVNFSEHLFICIFRVDFVLYKIRSLRTLIILYFDVYSVFKIRITHNKYINTCNKNTSVLKEINNPI
jgi:hypothetical protein